ncbi:hypothetical protein J6S37_02030 [Candidatus Saccharibacteria bacterium]|nr:hypothetical protein [Candidatus Saccharibacteria bacterium]
MESIAYKIISFLADFYAAATINKYLMVVMFWIFWPGLFFVVAVIFESRKAPLWRHQAKAFIPGDFAFGVAFTALVGLHTTRSSDDYCYNNIYWIILIMAFVVIFLLFGNQDSKSYPQRAAFSPTKVFHDVVGYFLIPVMLAGLGAKKLGDYFIVSRYGAENWMVFGFAIIFYLICVLYDEKKGFTEEDIKARHIEDWHPIWTQPKKPENRSESKRRSQPNSKENE